MNRAWPIGILFFVFLYLGANVSSLWLWTITGTAIFLLFSLMFAMYKKGQFVGPKTLINDVNFIKNKFFKDENDNSDINDYDINDYDINDYDKAIKRNRSSDDDL